MEQFVQTGNLILPSADLLITQVLQIENNFPGWWWSLSFSETNIILSMGPDKNAPDERHRKWMHSREGDLGFVHTIATHGGERKIILGDVVANTLESILGRLRVIKIDDRFHIDRRPVILDKGKTAYRYQNKSDIANLLTQYQSFVDQLDFIRTSEFIIREFYIGSCGLTADCSIRGGDDEHEFDCCGDNYHGNIGDALSIALGDLSQDIRATDPKNILLLQNTAREFM